MIANADKLLHYTGVQIKAALLTERHEKVSGDAIMLICAWLIELYLSSTPL